MPEGLDIHVSSLAGKASYALSAEQARKFILADLNVDPGCYDDDLRAVEDGVGEMIVKVENQHEERTHFPRAVAGGHH